MLAVVLTCVCESWLRVAQMKASKGSAASWVILLKDVFFVCYYCCFFYCADRAYVIRCACNRMTNKHVLH